MSLSNERATPDRHPVVDDLSEPLSAVAFWSAIALPLLYVPLLAAGIGSTQDLLLFLGLFALHLVALFGGRSYGSR
jgi:hypothetical protein